jgi:hypothetical protein
MLLWCDILLWKVAGSCTRIDLNYNNCNH